MQRRQNKQNLILKYKELYDMCVRSWYPDVYYHNTDLTHPYIYRIQLSTLTVYAPGKSPYTEFFNTVQRPIRIDFAIARSMQQGLSLRSSRSDLTLIYLDVTIHLRAAEGKNRATRV